MNLKDESGAGRSLDRLRRVARLRVTLGFGVALLAFWLATPTFRSLAAGAAIAVCGEALRMWAAGHIRKGREVTVSGPYGFTRHPLYLGSLVMGAGFAVAAANPLAAVLVLGYLLVMFWVAIKLEEAVLRQEFGTQYDRYAQGQNQPSARSFDLALAIDNGELRTLLGFAGALGVLAFKAWFSGSASGI